MLEGGGGSVTIGKCISICIGHSGGDVYFIGYSQPRMVVDHSRRTGGEPCGDVER